jgi:hypothetical protein
MLLQTRVLYKIIRYILLYTEYYLEHWSAVRPKQKTKCAVDNETISKYFENVLGADPPELSEEVLNLINNDHFENVDPLFGTGMTKHSVQKSGYIPWLNI